MNKIIKTTDKLVNTYKDNNVNFTMIAFKPEAGLAFTAVNSPELGELGFYRMLGMLIADAHKQSGESTEVIMDRIKNALGWARTEIAKIEAGEYNEEER